MKLIGFVLLGLGWAILIVGPGFGGIVNLHLMNVALAFIITGGFFVVAGAVSSLAPRSNAGDEPEPQFTVPSGVDPVMLQAAIEERQNSSR